MNVQNVTDRRRWLIAGAALILAGAAGYGLARTTAPDAPAATQAHAEEAGGEHTGEEGGVAMDATRIRAAGIQVVSAAGGALAAEIVAHGSVTPQPQGEAVLAARADGVVTRIDKRPGDAVRAGEALALIESRDASAISADRAAARARATAARQAFARETRLFEAGVSPRQDLEAAQAALAQAEAEVHRTTAAASAARVSSDGRTLAVVSPISGNVTVAPAMLGAYVAAGAELFRVADRGRIEVHAAVPAADAERVTPGDLATIETPTGVASAVVRSISPGLDTESRAATVVLTLTGANTLRPGQGVRARLTPRDAAAQPGRVVVPDEAVQSVEGRDVVFLRTDQGFKATQVSVGARGGGRAEVLSGLRAGQQVAGKGAFLLKAELGKGEAEHAH